MIKKLFTAFAIFLLCFHLPKEIKAQDKVDVKKTDVSTTTKHVLGEAYGGGKIFWLDETGQHGLIAATTDQSTKGIVWNPGKVIVTNANADALYSGLTNSEKIAAAQGTNGQYAARLCLDYATTDKNIVYNDWYLPSKYELNLLYRQKTLVGGFNLASGIYWSSTESITEPNISAWEQEFKYGSQYEDGKDMTDQVRCIRKF
jgi:hypothetical protein